MTVVDPSREPGTRSELDAATIEAYLAKVRAGDTVALEDLLTRLEPQVRRMAHGKLPSIARPLADTEDLVMLTLRCAYTNLSRFEMRHEGSLIAYLRCILVNQIRDQIRRAMREPQRVVLSEDLRDDVPAPDDAVITKEAEKTYRDLLAALRKSQRNAITLRVERSMSYEEIAQEMGLKSANSARMRVARGLERMSVLLEAQR
jgi:RNA polymerase sigma-70 factor (ECF subfamily)